MSDNSRLSTDDNNEGGDGNKYPGKFAWYLFEYHLLTVPVSIYNDGRGIRYKVKLLEKFPTLQAGEKRRSNAVCKHVNGIFHAHKLSVLGEILGYTIQSVKRNERTLDFKVVAGELCAKNFTVTWTIPHSSDKDMPLDLVDAFEDMVQQVEKKAEPEVALESVEDVCAFHSSGTYIHSRFCYRMTRMRMEIVLMMLKKLAHRRRRRSRANQWVHIILLYSSWSY